MLLDEVHELSPSAEPTSEIGKVVGFQTEITELVARTEKIFGSRPTLVPGKPDPGEYDYVVFRVRVPANTDEAAIWPLKSAWHDAALELLSTNAYVVRLILDYE